MGWVTAAVKLLPLVVGAIQAVESLVTSTRRGKDKEDAAIDALDSMIKVVETGLDQDVVDDQEFKDATRQLMGAYVAWQNVISKLVQKYSGKG